MFCAISGVQKAFFVRVFTSVFHWSGLFHSRKKMFKAGDKNSTIM